MNENNEELHTELYTESYFTSQRKILITFLIFAVVLIVFYFIATIFLSRGYREAMNAEYYNSVKASAEYNRNMLIIIDPGHGGEDDGASANGLIEKELNLDVSKKLAEFLSLSGYDVLMTRTEDVLLYKEGQENRKKYYDLYNRLAIAESYDDCIFVSIHMNKFPLESSHGLQVFYSNNNPDSEKLAEIIQSESKILDPTNKRMIKDGSNTILILENTTKPAVLVECGFLSNPTEAKRLADDEYQNKLAFVIFCGITKYIAQAETANNSSVSE